MSQNKSTELLLVEACKSNDPLNEVHTVYKEHYYNGDTLEASYEHMANIIGAVRVKYVPVDVITFAKELSPDYAWRFEDDIPHWLKVLQIHISAIRLTAASEFGDMFDEQQ